MISRCGWREEEVVDLMLGRLPADRISPLQWHISQCGRCGELYREWERLILADGSFPFPSAAVKYKLQNRFLRRYSLSGIRFVPGWLYWRRFPPGQGFAWLRDRSGAGFALSGTFAAFLLVLGLLSLRGHPPAPALVAIGGDSGYNGMNGAVTLRDQMAGSFPGQGRTAAFFPARSGTAESVPGVLAARDETAGFVPGMLVVRHGNAGSQPDILHAPDEIGKHLHVVLNPRTVQYPIIRPENPEVRGYIWVNQVTDEVLIMVEGLRPDDSKDYQAWFITAHHPLSGGIMRWQGSRAHLYAHGVRIRLADHLAVSQEPKGGSTKPTGPETFLVLLKNDGK